MKNLFWNKDSSGRLKSHCALLVLVTLGLKNICHSKEKERNPSSVPNRIGSVLFDKAKPQKIYLTPGLGSVIIFPCFVSDGFVGDESQASIRFSPSSKRNLLLSLKSTASHTTNLIVRCENDLGHFVFDIIPSHNTHQDVLEIRTGFGRPGFMSERSGMNSELEKPKTHGAEVRRIVIKEPKIVASSEDLKPVGARYTKGSKAPSIKKARDHF